MAWLQVIFDPFEFPLDYQICGGGPFTNTQTTAGNWIRYGQKVNFSRQHCAAIRYYNIQSMCFVEHFSKKKLKMAFPCFSWLEFLRKYFQCIFIWLICYIFTFRLSSLAKKNMEYFWNSYVWYWINKITVFILFYEWVFVLFLILPAKQWFLFL